MRRLGLATGLFVLLTAAAHADGSSKGLGEGGALADYFPIVTQYNESGELFRIEGECRSACTLFLAIRNVCIARDAQIGFHAGHDIRANVTGPQTRATRLMLDAYNDPLRKFLIEGHHMDTGEFYTLRGSTLIDRFGYRECPNP
jgi:hypothetical protein